MNYSGLRERGSVLYNITEVSCDEPNEKSLG